MGAQFNRFVRSNGALLVLMIGLFWMVIPQAYSAERMMIILDGSGSMWGQIDGKTKLEIARETLGEVLEGVADETELGLMSYGHREKGNCADIEIIVPAAAGNRSRIVDEVNQLKFMGKTPLTAAVKMAAEEMRYTEDKATVVLITDGLETCDANVCETASALEAQGIDFTAHVVGFGLSDKQGKQVACLAENTGGRYFAAKDADSLVEALTETIAAPVLPSVTFTAFDQDAKPLKDVPLNWKVLNDSGSVVSSVGNQTGLSISLSAGDYRVIVDAAEVAGGRDFTVTDEPEQQVEVPVEVQRFEATLEAPDEAVVGSEIEVAWTGPGQERDFISILEAGADQGADTERYISYVYTRQGTPAKLTVPDWAGDFELRYVLAESKKILATRTISVTDVEVTLEAPEEAPIGGEIEINWDGPDNDRDYITIVKPDAKQGSYENYQYTRQGNPMTLLMLETVGDYELRYVSGQSKRVLATKPISLVAVEATLDAPQEVASGSRFEVSWQGPANSRDYITIVEAGAEEGKYLNYAYTKKGSPLTILAPDATGDYEVRYVLGQSKTTLASRAIALIGVSASLDAPLEVPAGSTFEVSWSGPDNNQDYIAIAEAGAAEGKYLNYQYTKRGKLVKITGPDVAGDYELRYVVGQSKRTLAKKSIRLLPIEASLKAINAAVPGGKLTVEWTGPDNKGDFISIAEKGAPDRDYSHYIYTERGSPVTLKLPKALGTFEVRYMSGGSERVLERLDIQLKVITSSVSVASPAAPGSVVEVSWSGPGSNNDFIEIVPVDAEAKQAALSAARTAQGSPLSLFAPEDAGDYEVRYIQRDSAKVLSRTPLRVE